MSNENSRQSPAKGELALPGKGRLTSPLRKEANLSLHGEVALVTGASRGIGRSIAIRLAEEGASLVIVARNKSDLESAGQEIKSAGVPCLTYCLDISGEQAIESAIADVEQNLGPVSILVNNAGIYATQPIKDHPSDLWKQVMEVNLNAAVRASTRVLNGMIDKGWGRIVNISSISGKKGEPFGAAYSASKFAMLGFTQSLALECAKFGITVNAVCPGWVHTDMALQQLTGDDWCKLNQIDREESVRLAELSVPQMRFIEPWEVAELVAFLCSRKAAGITGQAINICGGLSLL